MSQTESEAKMLETVRKLIAKAESCYALGEAGEAEAEVFMGKANALMEKYAIDQALLDATRPAETRQVPSTITIQLVKENRAFMEIQFELLAQLAYFNRCQCWIQPEAATASVAGFKADTTYVDMLFTSIYFHMEQQFAHDAPAMRVKIKTNGKGAKGVKLKPMNTNMINETVMGPNYRLEFMRGYIRRLQQRFLELKRAQGTGQELVLAGIEDRVSDYVKSLGLHFASFRERSRTQLISEARDAGARAANQANLRPSHGLRRTGELPPTS